MLRYRLPLGAALIALLALVFWADELIGERTGVRGAAMVLCFLPAIALAARELCAIFAAGGTHTNAWLITTTSALLAGGVVVSGAQDDLFRARDVFALAGTMLFFVLVAGLIVHGFARKRTHGVAASTAATVLAFCYLGLLPSSYLYLRLEQSAWLIAGLLLTIKSCDIGAYFTGRFMGRHKLIPWLSPGKTWEGLVGGTVMSTLTGALLTTLAYDDPTAGAIAGFVLGIVGQFGDLCASLLKRDAQLKDSGRSLPGFGGVIDVVDSPLIAAPVAYWLVKALL